jgi:hypothetical protein
MHRTDHYPYPIALPSRSVQLYVKESFDFSDSQVFDFDDLQEERSRHSVNLFAVTCFFFPPLLYHLSLFLRRRQSIFFLLVKVRIFFRND